MNNDLNENANIEKVNNDNNNNAYETFRKSYNNEKEEQIA